MHKLTKKTVAIAAGTVLLLSGAGAAYAYWTTTGGGTGTADTGTTVPVIVNQTSAITGMYPGEAPRTLAGNFDNPNPGSVRVAAVTATGYTIDATHVSAGCIVADGHYTLGGTAPVGVDVATGIAQGAWTGLTIKMNNLASNQDFCKNAIVTITYASS